MLAFPAMLVPAAKEAGIKVPKNPDKFNRDEFPHFEIFCKLQLARRMSSWTEHWDNAKVIAKIPEDKLKKMTLGEFVDKGLKIVLG